MRTEDILKEESNRRNNWDDQIKQSELCRTIEAQEMNLFVLLDCTLTRDGNQWCVLYGEDLQVGICGFGDTPRLAIYDFNRQWDKTACP